MGTPEFAVPTLDILNKKYNVIGVFTQPPRPSGGGMNEILLRVPKVIRQSSTVRIVCDILIAWESGNYGKVCKLFVDCGAITPMMY